MFSQVLFSKIHQICLYTNSNFPWTITCEIEYGDLTRWNTPGNFFSKPPALQIISHCMAGKMKPKTKALSNLITRILVHLGDRIELYYYGRNPIAPMLCVAKRLDRLEQMPSNQPQWCLTRRGMMHRTQPLYLRTSALSAANLFVGELRICCIGVLNVMWRL
jgi:hypothetical protein